MAPADEFEPPTEPPHGFGDDDHDERSRALRRRPRPELLEWVGSSLGGRVVGTRARKGGSTSAIHEVRIAAADGRAPTTVILRSYVLAHVIEEEPDLVEQEERSLSLLGPASDLPTPAVLATDPYGTATGTPCLVMSRLAGRVDWFPAPAHLDGWLERLADVLVTLHDTPVPSDHGLPDFDPYEPNHWDPPPWLADPTRWDRAVELFHGAPLDDERRLIHRDYHPGNVLWTRRRVTGVVDWPVARIGPPSTDAFWCYLNLLPRFGPGVADRFLAIWEERSGRTYHPWAEVVLAVDVLDSRDDRRTPERVVLEERLARGLAALGVT